MTAAFQLEVAIPSQTVHHRGQLSGSQPDTFTKHDNIPKLHFRGQKGY